MVRPLAPMPLSCVMHTTHCCACNAICKRMPEDGPACLPASVPRSARLPAPRPCRRPRRCVKCAERGLCAVHDGRGGVLQERGCDVHVSHTGLPMGGGDQCRPWSPASTLGRRMPGPATRRTPPGPPAVAEPCPPHALPCLLQQRPGRLLRLLPWLHLQRHPGLRVSATVQMEGLELLSYSQGRAPGAESRCCMQARACSTRDAHWHPCLAPARLAAPGARGLCSTLRSPLFPAAAAAAS